MYRLQLNFVGPWYRRLIRIAALAWIACVAGDAPLAVAGDADVEAVGMLASRIDQRIEEKLHHQKIAPGPLCDDATFMRRLTLDLCGKNPTAQEIVAFLRTEDPHKRAALIDRLLESPASAVHLANTWSAWLLPEMQVIGPPAQAGGLQAWLRNRFVENLRYDRLVADLLVASGRTSAGPVEFFASLESKPEKIAARTARVFMGVQLDCAECHDHPFDHWKQRDFWAFAAYFARLSTEGMQVPGRMMEIADRGEGEVKLPNTDEIIAPRPLVATGLSGLDSGTRREQLTLWLTARENPYLARAAVNRCWSILFGRGLIEPIDDMRGMEMASHPELLSELAGALADHRFDLRYLLRSIANSHAYQRATLRAHNLPLGSESPVEAYAWMPVKPLTSLQLAACLQQVARQGAGQAGQVEAARLAQQLGRLRGDSSSATLGVVQALVTLHSSQLDKVHREDESRLIGALTAPHLKRGKQIEWLFLSTLCRLPSDEERDAVLAALPSDEVESEKLQWQSDLLWALVNSTEFAMTP